MIGLVLLHEPIFGAYTELFAGLSDAVARKDNGSFSKLSCVMHAALGGNCANRDDVVKPWGTLSKARKDIEAGCKKEGDGGMGTAERFWDWSEEQTRSYA